MASRVDDAWYAGAVAWDESVSRASILIAPDAILRTGGSPDPSLAITPWGRMVQQGDLLAPPDRVLLRTSGNLAQRPIVLSNVPAAVVSSRVDAPGSAIMFALRVHELVDATETQAIPLLMKPLPAYVSHFTPYEGPFFLEIDAAGGIIVACAGNELLVVPEKEVNKGALREPLHFRWRQDPLVLAGRAAKASYEVAAGAPPFQFKLTIEGVETRAESQARKAGLRVDVQPVAEAVLRRIRQFNWSDYAPAQDSAQASNDFRRQIADYMSAVTPYYQMLTGRKPRGVPVLVPALVEVVDKEMQTAQMQHYYLLELPESHVLVAFDPSGELARTSPAARRRSAAAGEGSQETKVESEVRERVADVDRQLSIEYSNKLREEYPSEPMPSKTLKERAAAARDSARGFVDRAINEVRSSKMKASRAWRDKKGRQTQAALKSFVAGRAVLTLASGKEVTVPVEKLSEDDQKFLADAQQSDPTSKKQASRAWRDKKGRQTQATLKSFVAGQAVLTLASGKEVTVPIDKLSTADQKFLADVQQADPSELELAVAQLTLLGQGMLKHESARDAFPPAFIVDPKGKPLLSWRVAILPYVGGEELFRLFHLDEPWDSEHNRLLLEFMPSVFAPAARVDAAGKTPFLAIRHPRSVLGGRPISGGILDGYFNVAAFGEVGAARAVPWTRPNDIPAANLTVLKSWLNAREKSHLVGFLGGKVQALPTESLSTKELLSAVDYKDQTALSKSFYDPLALPDSSARQALAQTAAAEPEPADKTRPRPADDAPSAPAKGVRVQLAENSPVGAVVGKVTGAPSGYTYRIVNQNDRDHDHHSFAIHPTTGVVTVKDNFMLNADSFPSFLLQIVASDSRGKRVPIQMMQVVLGDKNEPPTVSGSGPVQLHDFVREGDNVGLVAGRDPEGDMLTYEVDSKDLGDIIRIDKRMGFLQAGSPRDINKLREGRTYKVKVTVTDKHGLTDSTEIDVSYAKVR